MALFPSSGNTQVVHKHEPILVQAPLEDCKDQSLEIFGSICGAEFQACGEPTTAGRENVHFLARLRLVVHLVEPFLQVPY